MKNPPSRLSAEALQEQLYAKLRSDVAARLREVCSEWSAEDFNTIVDKVTATALRHMKPEEAAAKYR